MSPFRVMDQDLGKYFLKTLDVKDMSLTYFCVGTAESVEAIVLMIWMLESTVGQVSAR